MGGEESSHPNLGGVVCCSQKWVGGPLARPEQDLGLGLGLDVPASLGLGLA